MRARRLTLRIAFIAFFFSLSLVFRFDPKNRVEIGGGTSRTYVFDASSHVLHFFDFIFSFFWLEMHRNQIASSGSFLFYLFPPPPFPLLLFRCRKLFQMCGSFFRPTCFELVFKIMIFSFLPPHPLFFFARFLARPPLKRPLIQFELWSIISPHPSRFFFAPPRLLPGLANSFEACW